MGVPGVQPTLSAAEKDEVRARVLRSANSMLAQARSLFARSRRNDLPAYYERHGLALPPCIEAFKRVPGFPGTTKSEYHAPREDLVLETLRAVEKLAGSTDPLELNVYKAVWCALGFGLRKRHIAAAKVGDFHKEGGDVFFRPASNGGKNHSEIGVQLDAWERLAPHVEGRPKSEYLLTGTDTERQDEVFRRLSALFKSLGWETQHHIHELRAWAGCRIVAGPDGKSENWEAGRRFLKHRFTHTTQNFYGHHFQAKIAKVSLPSLAIPEAKIIPAPLPAVAG